MNVILETDRLLLREYVEDDMEGQAPSCPMNS
jgi:hypothetical protein